MRPICSKLDLSCEEGRKSEYYTLVADLLDNEVFCRMKVFTHHGSTTCFQHCLNVSYHNYLICKLLSLNTRAAARAGLLHDLFLYDWHTYIPPKGEKLHGFTHAATALANVNKHFDISAVEKDIIEKHMFPLTFAPPRYRETMVIVFVDKFCGAAEVLANLAYKTGSLFKGFRRRTDTIHNA